ncbi:hypothetical protein CF319_g5700 [Tilletia indica]|uniref:Mediator of RNA polymerase II transcription subunit 21 n=1 Tax=Tilletia indica TaxID=43049 RepID=A0A8T8ST24_9BASI|nr:hypothetical protein CF319_g5700 [Tilletia indica]KAE8246854.1 hypothetical protein A4X13_0g5602 [Tilletia indica]
MTDSTPNKPSPLPPSLTIDNDPLTKLEDSLDLLIKIMAGSLSYCTLRASHVTIHPEIPISAKEATRASAKLVELDEMQGAIDELVLDLVRKAKDVEGLIATLPDGLQSEEDQTTELAALDNRIRTANADFKLALEEAESLQSQLTALLRNVQHQQQLTRLHLQRSLAAPSQKPSLPSS